jgi:hypothetical protein
MQDENYFKTLWANMSDQEKMAFGGSEALFLEKFKKGIDAATNSFKKAEENLEKMGYTAKEAAEKMKEYGYMTADQAKAWTDKLVAVSEKAGGQNAVQQVEDAREKLLANQTDIRKTQIQNLINSTDWTNLEELLALQIDL